MTGPIQSIFEQYYLLFATLLVQVAMVAMVASLLLRFPRFTRLLLEDPPGSKTRMEFGIVLGVIVAVGAWTRLNLGYTGTDLTVIGPFLGGLYMGYDAGLWVALIGGLIPARHGEWLTLAVGLVIGVGAGLSRRLYRNPNSVRDFSPVPFGNIGHIWRRWRKDGELDARVLVIVTVALAEVFRTEVARFAGERWLFSYAPQGPITYYAVILACLTSIGVSLKIWNTPRIEARLRRQEALLAEARLDVLRGQINPHFLFNTLNTINTLIRTHPDQARKVVIRLCAILRRMLYAHENTATLKKELDGVEDYLGIEMIRFGKERLQVIKDIAPEALTTEVPTMLIQPIVENAIKHGISQKERGGVITIAAKARGSMLEITVRDNGVGMSAERLKSSLHRGIGLTNVRERLRSLYEDAFRLEVESAPGRGTLVRILLPWHPAGGSALRGGAGYIRNARS